MTGPDLGEWEEAFETVIDGFGASANKAINRVVLLDEREGLPADFPPPLYALALALGAVAAGTQKAAEFAHALAPHIDREEALTMLHATVAEHWARKLEELATPEPTQTRQ